MSKVLRSLSRSRPVRVAYFVEETEHFNFTLDAIIERSHGFWGGRFSLIIPCVNAQPMPEFDNWLEAYDPDVIYSYVDLADDAVELLHERLYPSFLVRHQMHDDKDLSARSFWPRLPIDLLNVESLVPYVSGPDLFDPSRKVKIVDAHGEATQDAFIRDNFGYFLGSASYSFPARLKDYAEPLVVLRESELQPRRRYGLPDEETIEDKTALLTEMAKSKVWTMAALSRIATPRLEVDRHRWADAFNIVVGDSFIDRVCYWNARSLFRRWRDREYVDMRIPAGDAEDRSFLDAVADILADRNWVSGDSSSGPGRVVLRSSSLPKKELDAIAEHLKEKCKFMHFNSELISSLTDCVPDVDQFKHSRLATSESAWGHGSSEWQEATLVADQVRINPPEPDHLRFAPPSMLTPHQGTWGVDLEIERDDNYAKYKNVPHFWHLPRRLRITSQFLKGYQINSPSGQFVMPRVSRNGRLTLLANSGSTFPAFSVPNDNTAIASALVQGRDWWPFNRFADEGDALPNQVAKDVKRSENGLYFWGIFHMLKSFSQIEATLLHDFWRGQFERLGASSAVVDTRKSEIEEILRKRLRTKLDEKVGENLGAVSNLMLKEADQLRRRRPVISWSTVKNAHDKFQDDFLEEYKDIEHIDVDEWRSEATESLKLDVQRLCQLGILHQGFEIQCKTCLHRAWTSIEKIQNQILCAVCGATSPAPVAEPWEFRLNEFVLEGLRVHGLLPVFWALSKIRGFNCKSFFFEGPMDIYFDQYQTEARGSDCDIDLICVSDGIVRMCEVKQSARQLRKIDDFPDVVKRLRPDIATIAVMEPVNARITSRFEEFKAALNGSGIQPELITLDDQDFEDDPSLGPTGRYRVL